MGVLAATVLASEDYLQRAPTCQVMVWDTANSYAKVVRRRLLARCTDCSGTGYVGRRKCGKCAYKTPSCGCGNFTREKYSCFYQRFDGHQRLATCLTCVTTNVRVGQMVSAFPTDTPDDGYQAEIIKI